MKHIIIGGVAGGATAAARIRRANEKDEIILIEKGSYISYANCGLPYYIGGTIAEREKLFLQTPASFGSRFRVDVRVENEVVEIDSENKNISVRRNDGTIYVETFDKLLLSPGAVAVKPPFKGVDADGVFTLRNVEDTDKIKNFVTARKIKKAVVVGAGFIGLEMAENLHQLGAEVSIVEMSNQVMAPLDFSMAAFVRDHLIQKGVNLYLEQSLEQIENHTNTLHLKLSGGEIIETEMVILSIGVRPETTLAKKAGLKIGETGGIWVNNYLETSVQNIYAVGDAIEFPHPITGKPWLNYLANPANRQGRIVADNMVFGNQTQYEGAIGTSIAKVFDLTVASTGLAAKKLKQLGIKYQSSTTHSNNHAGYYPGASQLSLKLTFDPETGKIFGAQSIGYEGVDKRIDQIAMLIKQGGKVVDLTETEHCYAPPYSSAKDPIAIAGYVANNIVTKTMAIATWREILVADGETSFILDVRTPAEFSFGAIAGAKNIPVDELRNRLNEIPTDKPILVYCAVGLRGYLAYKILIANGFTNTKNLSGGYKTYSVAISQPNVHTPIAQNNKEYNADTQTFTMSIKTTKIDACGLQCPGPIIKLKQAIDQVVEGERVEITSTDNGFMRDAGAWCNTTGNKLISSSETKGQFTVVIEKGGIKNLSNIVLSENRGKTLVVFSDDLDKALAAFVIATGAAATGEKVSIFFTFWGLNVIKKVKKPKVEKDIFGRMFSMMLPSSSLKLHLSKMSMLGIGDRMMRFIMKKKGIESLETLRNQAIEMGVEFIACQMSMDVMGVDRQELLDDVTIGGVATYMERADKSTLNLFI